MKTKISLAFVALALLVASLACVGGSGTCKGTIIKVPVQDGYVERCQEAGKKCGFEYDAYDGMNVWRCR